MSKTIHMETEQVRQTAARLSQVADQMEHFINASLTRVKAIPWEGSDREQYVASLSALTQRLLTLANAGRTLGVRAHQEADEWEAADQKSAGSWGEACAALGMATAVPALMSLPATGSSGTVLAEYTGVDEVDQYVDDHTENSPVVDPNDQLYEEALKRVGGEDTKHGEGPEHYNWRIAREIEYLKFLAEYYEKYVEGSSPGHLLPPFLENFMKWVGNSFKWFGESSQNDARDKAWQSKYPEPEYGG